MIPRPTVTIVVTAHREGLLASATLKSASRAIEYASHLGYSAEAVISLDRADALTGEVVRSWSAPNTRVLDCDFGDLGLSRNRCIAEAHGEFVATLDADDLFGENWIGDAVTAASADRRDIVWHPEVNLVFGEQDHIFRHIDMESDEFELLSMIATNPWTALCFARREIFLRAPYPASDLRAGVGFEDWGWNRSIVESGCIHKVVKGTGHAIRRKANSLVRESSAAGVLPAQTSVFRRVLENRVRLAEFRRPLGPIEELRGASASQRGHP